MACSRALIKVEALSKVNPFYDKDNLPEPPRPDLRSIPRGSPSIQQIEPIQNILNTLSYNHLPQTFFNLDKHRSLQSVLMTAKEILAEALPIRCLEATFVGLYLTQELKDVDRIPLAFKSFANGQYYRHIVLLLHCRSRFGVLGLSRKSTLMYKPMTFASIFDVVMDFKREYEAIGHTLVDMKIGLHVSRDVHSRQHMLWRFVALRLALFSGQQPPGDDTAPPTPGSSGAEGPVAYEPLRAFLAKYAKLLPALSEQFYKGLAVTDMRNCGRGTRLCFVDLDEAYGYAAEENARRVGLIAQGHSPLSLEARRAAANRQFDRRGSRAAVTSPASASRAEQEHEREKTPASAAAPVAGASAGVAMAGDSDSFSRSSSRNSVENDSNAALTPEDLEIALPPPTPQHRDDSVC